MPRAFLAVDLPPEAKAEIKRLQDETEKSHPGIYRWTELQNLHLTLYFLGELDQDVFEKIQSIPLTPAPIDLKLGQILLLPETNVPKILSLNLEGQIPELKKLQQRIHDSVFNLAQNKETRPFTPHITIARLKKGIPPSAKPVKKLLGALKPPKTLSWKCDTVHLYISTLTGAGPTYEVIASFTSNSSPDPGPHPDGV